MKDIVIIGSGGLGREIAWLIEDNNSVNPEWNILGFISEDTSNSLKYPVLGGDEWLLNYGGSINAVCCIGNSKLRKRVISKYSNNPNVIFPNIISRDVKMSDSVNLGKGVIICCGTILTTDIDIGDYCIINPNCTIGHDAVLHDFVTLYPSVNVSGATNIGYCCELGTGMQIIQGKTVGDCSIVGAGAVVIKDIPANCTAVGIPAKPIKFHNQ